MKKSIFPARRRRSIEGREWLLGLFGAALLAGCSAPPPQSKPASSMSSSPSTSESEAVAGRAPATKRSETASSATSVHIEVFPNEVRAGETVMIRVAIADETGIDDWFCVPKLGDRLLNDLRFGDFWTRGFERPTTVDRFYQRTLEQLGEYDFFVTAWDAQRNARESNHVKVKVTAAATPK